MYTLRDVAPLAGGSLATISKVLNEKGSVRPKLAQRVLSAMEALDYHPGQVARNLKVRQTQTIGIVIPDSSNPFYTDVIRGVETEARLHGYSLIPTDSTEDRALEETNIDMLLARRGDGVLLAPTTGSKIQGHVTRRRVPLVLFDRLCPALNCSAVVAVNFAGAYDATRHLLQLGHRRVAIITGRWELPNAVDRLEGFGHALQEVHLPLPQEYPRGGRFQLESGYQHGLELMRPTQLPTAVFSCNNKMTLGFMRALYQLHMPFPEQLSVLGFDDFDWAVNSSPGLTTVAQPALEMGRQAMQMLLAKIESFKTDRSGAEEKVVSLKATLQFRDSTAAPFSPDNGMLSPTAPGNFQS